MELHTATPFQPCSQVPLIVADFAGVPLKVVINESSTTTYLVHPDSSDTPITSTSAIAVLLCKTGGEKSKNLIGMAKNNAIEEA